jgi:hypothetical protein
MIMMGPTDDMGSEQQMGVEGVVLFTFLNFFYMDECLSPLQQDHLYYKTC